jgi:hypothetical protein
VTREEGKEESCQSLYRIEVLIVPIRTNNVARLEFHFYSRVKHHSRADCIGIFFYLRKFENS